MFSEKGNSCVYKYHVFILEIYRSILLSIPSEIATFVLYVLAQKETRVYKGDLDYIKQAHSQFSGSLNPDYNYLHARQFPIGLPPARNLTV